MKIILLEDIKGKGKKDQIISVADGYGTFLIKQNKALLATPESLKILDKKLNTERALHEKNIAEALELKKYLETIVVNFSAKLTPRGTITKKITSRDITNKLNNKFNINIDKHKIEMLENIVTVGSHIVKIKLYNNILVNLSVVVIAE